MKKTNELDNKKTLKTIEFGKILLTIVMDRMNWPLREECESESLEEKRSSGRFILPSFMAMEVRDWWN
jgi:hypothetical protein